MGHHGSRNATPQKLWDLFSKRKGKKLKTLMSTAAGVYDKSEDGKVPSTNLVNALKSGSELVSTLGRKATVVPIEVEVV